MQTFTLNSRFMANVELYCFCFIIILKEPQNLFGLEYNTPPIRKQNLCWGTSSAAGNKTPHLSEAWHFQSFLSFHTELLCLSWLSFESFPESVICRQLSTHVPVVRAL